MFAAVAAAAAVVVVVVEFAVAAGHFVDQAVAGFEHPFSPSYPCTSSSRMRPPDPAPRWRIIVGAGSQPVASSDWAVRMDGALYRTLRNRQGNPTFEYCFRPVVRRHRCSEYNDSPSQTLRYDAPT